MTVLEPAADDPPLDDDGLLSRLLQELDRAPVGDLLDVSFDVLRGPLRLRHLWLFVADYSEESLHPVPSRTSPPPDESFSIRGTVPGRVYTTRQPVRLEGNGDVVLWIPVFRRSDNVGVLGLGLEDSGGRAEALATAVGLAIGSAVLSARRHSDVFELARGARHLRLAAAMQWDLLPLPTFAEPSVQVAGRVEPAYDIGGDAFDFAVNRDRVELAVLDAMGHGLPATLLTTLAVGAYRFSRRRESTLQGVARDIDEALVSHTAPDTFVTGHLCRLDTTSGLLSWLNVGHPIPLLIRDQSAAPLGEADPMLPFGLAGEATEVVDVSLQPGDLVLFYSDGVVEARPDGGEEFGMERFLDFAGRHGDRDAELLILVRQILDAVVEYAGGTLRDDATLVAIRWVGPS